MLRYRHNTNDFILSVSYHTSLNFLMAYQGRNKIPIALFYYVPAEAFRVNQALPVMVNSPKIRAPLTLLL